MKWTEADDFTFAYSLLMIPMALLVNLHWLALFALICVALASKKYECSFWMKHKGIDVF